MAPLASCFLGVFCGGAFPAQNVLLIGDNIQMAGINTPTIATKMVEDSTPWDFTAPKQIHETVRFYVVAPKPEFPISRSFNMPAPRPTFRARFNLGKEA